MPIVVLVLNPEGGEGGYVQLENRPYIIGRMEDLDIELDSPSISRRHARFFQVGGDWYLEDLDSRNGSSINGKRIKQALLQEGDICGIGPMTAFFFTECSLGEIGNLRQNFPRLKEMAAKYGRELASANKPLLDPSEKIPLIKAKASGFGSEKKPSLLSDIASGRLRGKSGMD